MVYGATLGGNGILVETSLNIVAAGIAKQHAAKITFRIFLKDGILVMIIQLSTAAFYVAVFFLS